MLNRLSLAQRFSVLLTLFVLLTATVLYMYVAAKNEPIEFGLQELRGNAYQKPLEKLLSSLMRHHIEAQRVLSGRQSGASKLSQYQEQVDSAIEQVEEQQAAVGEELQFTEEGLASRKREHFTISNLKNEWSELKSSVEKLKVSESHDRHAHLIADARTMVTHLGDTSNLVLDPDLDSYYLMDMTLLAIPQTQDRIHNVMIDMESIFKARSSKQEDRVKASVFASMMKEADLERIKADFQTVLNEDKNFSGVSATLAPNLTAAHDRFVAAYQKMIDTVNAAAAGDFESYDQFVTTSEAALNESFKYWDVAGAELDSLLNQRVSAIRTSKNLTAMWSVLALAIVLVFAYLFLKSILANLRKILGILQASTKEVAEASSGIAQSSTKLSESSTEQAAGLQETTASVEEISAMISQNANSANRSKSAVDENQVLAKGGSESMVKMLSAVSEIKESNDSILSQMARSNEEFKEIVSIISEIDKKTNVINEIVFQTKLLSFNASVEAARAGEHGKGFAVVAEEVGSLAEMSGKAAREIKDMLSGSITKVNSIVDETQSRVGKLIEVGKEKIESGESTAHQCQAALQKITETANAIVSIISEITTATVEQAQGIQEINKAMTQLDQVTQQNSAAAQLGSSQAEQLKGEAAALSNALDQLVVFVDGQKSA